MAARTGAGSAADAPGGALAYVAWLEYGLGTGAISSPLTLCEASSDGRSTRRLSNDIGYLGEPAWSRDGRLVAYTADDPQARATALRVTPRGPWRPRTIARGSIAAPAWSPDGTRLAFASHDPAGIHLIGADGKGRRLLVPGRLSHPSWSPDGRRIAYAMAEAAGAESLWVTDVDGSDRRKLVDDGGSPAWSPDGRRIAFVGASPGARPGVTQQELYAVGPDGSGRTQLTHFVRPSSDPQPVDTILSAPAWAPDASAIAVVRTVSVRSIKGTGTVDRRLFLVDPAAAVERETPLRGAIGAPTWRPGIAVTSADATSRPCTIVASRPRTVRGTAYDDLILGSDGPDAIASLRGDDWIHGARGSDRIVAGAGADEVWSGRGRDTVDVRDGARDLVHCGEAAGDVGVADRADTLIGNCNRVARR